MESPPSSVHLLRASQAGDVDALDTLLTRHVPALWRFVQLRMSRLLLAHESASDLVQATCREVLLGLRDFEDWGEGAFRGRLFTDVLNTLRRKERDLRAKMRDARRLTAPDGEGEEADEVAGDHPMPSPSQAATADETSRRLEAAFDQLPEHYREVLTLSRVAHLQRAEIARLLGRSEDSVRNLMMRALTVLSQRLGEGDG